MTDERRLSGFQLVVVGIAAILVAAAVLTYAIIGIGSARAQSEYTGHVVDVVEDKGLIFRPSWVNMKTDPRSSDIQRFCIHPRDEERLLPKFYDAMESGDRHTITYSRPVWVSPQDCPSNAAIISDISPVNKTE